MRYYALVFVIILASCCTSCAKREVDLQADETIKYDNDSSENKTTHINDIIGEEDEKVIVDANIIYSENIMTGKAILEFPSVEEIQSIIPKDEYSVEKKELEYDDRDTDIYWEIKSDNEEWYYDLQETDNLALLDNVKLKDISYIQTTNEEIINDKIKETDEYKLTKNLFETLGYDCEIKSNSNGKDNEHSQYCFKAVQNIEEIPFLFLVLGGFEYNSVEIKDKTLSSLVLEPRVKVVESQNVNIVSPEYIVEQIKADYNNGKIQIFTERIDEISIGYTVISEKLIPVWGIYSYIDDGEKYINMAYDAETGELLFDELNGLVIGD